MFGGHVTELFDQWDHTASTGKDIDYAVVIVAGCLGVAVLVVKKLASAVTSWFVASIPPEISMLRSLGHALVPTISSFTGPSPPLLSPLRI